MKREIVTIVIALAVVFFSSCTSLRRYNSVTKPEIDSSLANVDLFGISISRAKPENSSKSLWDLSADAQSQFIKILNSRYPNNDEFLNSLSFEYMKGREELLTNDYVSKELRLIFSVSKKPCNSSSKPSERSGLSPADRIENLKISLSLRDTTLKFTGWNMCTTEYGSIDIGNVSFSKTFDIKGSGSLSAKKEMAGGDASASGTVALTRKEDQSVSYRYLKLNGRINKQKIEIEEEGTREIDLTGNIIADVTLEFDRSIEKLIRFTGLKDSLGAYNPPEKLSTDVYLAAVPKRQQIDELIHAELKMDFVYRNVRSGGRTYPEWDDRVKYFTGTVTKTIPLFTARDYVPGFYCLGSVSENNVSGFVGLDRGGDNIYPLIFCNYEEASAFYSWLMHFLNLNRGRVINLGDQLLKFRNSDLTWDQVKNDSRFGVLPYYW